MRARTRQGAFAYLRAQAGMCVHARAFCYTLVFGVVNENINMGRWRATCQDGVGGVNAEDWVSGV